MSWPHFHNLMELVYIDVECHSDKCHWSTDSVWTRGIKTCTYIWWYHIVTVKICVLFQPVVACLIRQYLTRQFINFEQVLYLMRYISIQFVEYVNIVSHVLFTRASLLWLLVSLLLQLLDNKLHFGFLIGFVYIRYVYKMLHIIFWM